MKQNTAFMITPEEAISMGDYVDLSTIDHAMGVSDALRKGRSEYDPHDILPRAALYRAGVIDGIRRERARRKALTT